MCRVAVVFMFRLSSVYRTAYRTVCTAVGDEMKGKFYYAVRRGTTPGVYPSWDECKQHVDKFTNASFKKFASEKDAWAFVRGVTQMPAPPPAPPLAAEPAAALLPRRGPEPLYYIPLGHKRSRSDARAGSDAWAGSDIEAGSATKRVRTIEDSETPKAPTETSDGFTYMGDAVVVYTDGCCTANGQHGARAGIGVYWGPDHPLNVADRLSGRQTNQRAEILAACRALEQAIEKNIKKLVLYTDSKFTINGVTSWVKTWKTNGWKLKSGGPIINKEDFMKLDALNSELEVVWLHIPGHAGYTGNEQADRLSRQGAAKV